MKDSDLTMLEELLDTTGMPDKTVEFIDSLDKFYRRKGLLTSKQRAAIRKMWEEHVRDA